jgi:DNA-binding SARP family transcriptional activator
MRSTSECVAPNGLTQQFCEPPDPALASEVFEAYPYGVVVVDGRRRVLAYNPAAQRLLGAIAGLMQEPQFDAERLFGVDGQAHESGAQAMFERALAAEGPLPEFRIDMPSGARASALWVTLAPMRDGSDHVIVELRPGDARDRRRRTDPRWGRQPKLRVGALGRTRVEIAGGAIGGPWLAQRPGELLKYLVSQRQRPVSAEEIAERLWPEAGPRVLRGVRYYVHTLRTRLEPHERPRAGSSFVLYEDGGYRLSTSRVTVDADDFEREALSGLAAARSGPPDAALKRLTRAMDLYGGDFLADEPYADWARPERDHLRSVAGDALSTLARLRVDNDDLEGAARDLAQLAELEPFDVEVHRRLITLALRRGRRSDALRRYEALRRRMLTTFGEELGFSLVDLAGARNEI